MSSGPQPALQRMIALYRDAYARHGDSAAAVLWPKGRQSLRFEALTAHLSGGGFSVLDFGCGLAHLKAFLDERYRDVRYAGADVVAEFIEACRRRYPQAAFQHLQGAGELAGEYDHIVASGTFNLVAAESEAEHRELVRASLRDLWARTRVSLAVNFMTDDVDFRQPGAYHENVASLRAFACTALSRRLRIDQSYMPYEFTVTVFRDDEIVRPDNVYRSL